MHAYDRPDKHTIPTVSLEVPPNLALRFQTFEISKAILGIQRPDVGLEAFPPRVRLVYISEHGQNLC